MRLLRLAIPVALLSLVAACGGSSTTTTPPAAVPTSAQTSSAPTTSAPTSSSAPSSSAGAGSGQALTGAVQTELTDFSITLKNAAGADVTTLPAGTYQVVVKDPSIHHNFHLMGPGVEQTTSVEGLADPTWTVTLTAGTYTYKCDPHPNMVKTFTVT